MKPILILQMWGLGDLIFSQGVVQHLINENYKVIWPIKPHYVKGCQRAYPHISFLPDTIIKPEILDIKTKDEYDGIMIAPIRWSDSYMKVPYQQVMRAKYDMYWLKWETWKDYALWVRDFDKENSLVERLGIMPGEKFNIINRRFGSNSERQVDIIINNGNRNIEITEISDFSLFDWSWLIENAEYVHVANSAILFMLEVLNLKAKEVHLYCRKPIEQNFLFTKYIFTKPYILHE